MNNRNDHFGNVFDEPFLIDEMDESEIDFDIDCSLDLTPHIESPALDNFQHGVLKTGGSKRKKRKFNPDSVVIAAITAETLQQLELDPNSKDGKQKKRQIRNRMSAQYHRDRKNAYIVQLEQTVDEKSKEVQRLQLEVNFLVHENTFLKAFSGNMNESFHHGLSSLIASDNYGGLSGGLFQKNDTFTEDSGISVQSVLSVAGCQNSANYTSIEKFDVFNLSERKCESITVGLIPSHSDSRGLSGISSPTFVSSPLSRSMTIISMICVLSIMIFGGNIPNPFESNSVLHFPALKNQRLLSVSNTFDDKITSNQISSNKPSVSNGVSGFSTLEAANNDSQHDESHFIVNLNMTLLPKVRHLRFISTDNHQNKSRGSNILPVTHLSTSKLISHVMQNKGSQSFGNSNDVYRVSDQSNSFGFSRSTVVVSDGRALLDPAIFKITGQLSSDTTSSTISRQTVRSVIPSLNSDLNLIQSSSDRHLFLSNLDAVEIDGTSREKFMSQLLSESNLVNIQLPLSLIHKSVVDSDIVDDHSSDGSTGMVDLILKALNLRSFYRSPEQVQHDTHSYSFPKNDTTTSSEKSGSSEPVIMIEINCLILGAKLVVTTNSV